MPTSVHVEYNLKKKIMNNFNLYLPDPAKKRVLCSKKYQYSIEMIDLETKKTLFQRTDSSGYHCSGIFTEDENVVLYITYDKHWYFSPTINIWDLKKGSVESILTDHNTQSEWLLTAFNKNRNLLALGDYDGSFSTYNIQTRAVIKHVPAIPKSAYNQILCLCISECGEKLAILRKDVLVIYDFTTAEKLFSTPLMETYSKCKFREGDAIICVTHPEKSPINISTISAYADK